MTPIICSSELLLEDFILISDLELCSLLYFVFYWWFYVEHAKIAVFIIYVVMEENITVLCYINGSIVYGPNGIEYNDHP